MIRINLLPPEIIEKRKYERFYPYVFAVTGILAVIVLGVWGYLQLLNSARVSELQAIEQSAADLRTQADSLAVFELKELDLAKRQEAAGKALAGRIDVGRVAEEISLVLPEEVWLTQLELHAPPEPGTEGSDQPEKLIGHAPDPAGTTVRDGFKLVASTLVRLASLSDSLNDVWLNRATVGRFNQFQAQADANVSVPSVEFEVEAQLKPTDSTGAGQ